ncbi:MAG: cupin domain-containing protein [Steroidobacteraceae bacterium]
MSVDLIDFRAAVETVESTPEPGRRVEEVPLQQTRNAYSDPTGRFHVGHWASDRGAWRIRYSEYELCHLLTGSVVIESESGTSWSFGQGDSFMIPKGFVGIWRVIEPCEKLYAIYEESPSAG